jgi:glycosyltransferase involved in cell wall biosynthesis
MQVHQMVASLSYGDAISNEALRIQDLLRSRGYESEIFAESVHSAMRKKGHPLWDYERVSSSDNVLILHFSIGAGVSSFAHQLPDRIMLIYHNITPARWFAPYQPKLARLCYQGRRELAAFTERTALALGVSEFNRQELDAMGFHPTGVLPLLLDPEQLAIPPSPVICRMFDDDKTNFLFVGRVIPNKKFEDLIKVFYVYQKFVDPKSRLLLVGEYRGFERYFDALWRLVDELELKDVVFAGHVDSNDLAAYYQVGDVFLSLSEHEGFCAPLLEAFRFGIPVMAFDAGAVPDTMSGAGVLIREKHFEEIAEMAHQLVHDDEMRRRVIDSQDRVIEALDARDDKGLLVGYVEQVTNGVKA